MDFIKNNHNVLPMLTSTDVRYSSASGSELSRKPELNSRYTSISVVVSGTPQAYHSFNVLAPSRILRTTRTMIDRARMVEGRLTAGKQLLTWPCGKIGVSMT